MEKILNWIERLITYLRGYFMINDIGDFAVAIIEIILFGIVIYKLIELVSETRAWQLLKGVLILLFVALGANLIGFRNIAYLLNSTLQILAFALVVVFQDELKKILERLGKSNIKNIFNDHSQSTISMEKVINEIVEAACALSSTETGGLIVIERTVKLGEIIATGIKIDSDVSKELIEQIFVPNTPLHDGAIVIREGKIMAASCLLPLTSNVNLSKELGTRHRAAIGISEGADCVVVVVSEETGKISVTMEGKIRRGFDNESLKNFLNNSLLQEEKKPKKGLFRIRGKRNDK